MRAFEKGSRQRAAQYCSTFHSLFGRFFCSCSRSLICSVLRVCCSISIMINIINNNNNMWRHHAHRRAESRIGGVHAIICRWSVGLVRLFGWPTEATENCLVVFSLACRCSLFSIICPMVASHTHSLSTQLDCGQRATPPTSNQATNNRYISEHVVLV